MIIAIQCTSDPASFNPQLKEKFPYAHERYLDKINGDVPMIILLGNNILCEINPELKVVNMIADTKEHLNRCMVDLEQYAKKHNQEVKFNLVGLDGISTVQVFKEKYIKETDDELKAIEVEE